MAGQPAMSPVQGLAGTPFLAADIGGTHARVGLVRGQRGSNQVTVLAYQKYTCADHPDLESIVHDFLEHHAQGPVRYGALACAGYVIDGVVINDNLPWKVAVDALRHRLDLSELVLINDFEAVAYATQYLDPGAATPLTRPADVSPKGPEVVVGPGTGLGSAVLLPGDAQPTVLATEAGQIALAPGNMLEADILRVLAEAGEHVSYEHALSGPGLINLYNALCTLEGATPALASPEAITAAALADNDAMARRTLDVFCGMLGGFAGDLAMLYGASGGVWLAGGILPQIRDFLVRSSFVERFLDKGRMRAFLERVPVRLMEHGQLGVIGAAGWYLDHGSPEKQRTEQGGGTGPRSGDRQ
ncbi:MAG TPA: glucokinase [Rhodanobacteraceae bacterium]